MLCNATNLGLNDLESQSDDISWQLKAINVNMWALTSDPY